MNKAGQKVAHGRRALRTVSHSAAGDEYVNAAKCVQTQDEQVAVIDVNVQADGDQRFYKRLS